MTVSPVGLRARITISDPWDFVTENAPFSAGTIVGFRDGSAGPPEIQIELDTLLKERGLVAREIFARPRHRDDTIERLLSGEELSYNFSNVSDEEWDRRDLDERMGFIGALRLEPRLT